MDNLVPVDPAEIDFHVLPSLPVEERISLPSCSAIYFAVSSEEKILYIGRAGDLLTRWLLHHRYNQLCRIGGVPVCWLEVSDSTLLPAIERALISYFKPVLNGTPVEDKVDYESRRLAQRHYHKTEKGRSVLRRSQALYDSKHPRISWRVPPEILEWLTEEQYPDESISATLNRKLRKLMKLEQQGF